MIAKRRTRTATPRRPTDPRASLAALHWPLLVAEFIAATAAAAAISVTINEPAFEVALHATIALGIAASLLAMRLGRSASPIGVAIMVTAFALYALRLNWSGGAIALAYPAEIIDDEELGLATLVAWFLAGFCFMQVSRANLIFIFVPGLTIFGLAATRNLNPELLGVFLAFLLASLYAWGYDHFLEVAGSHPAARDWRRWARVHFPGATLIFALAVAGGCLLGNALYYTTPRFYTTFGLQQRLMNSSGAHVQGYFMMLQQFDLGGGPIRLSQEPVLKAKTERATLWRGRAFDYYDGHGWSRTAPYTWRAVRTDDRTFNLRLLHHPGLGGGAFSGANFPAYSGFGPLSGQATPLPSHAGPAGPGNAPGPSSTGGVGALSPPEPTGRAPYQPSPIPTIPGTAAEPQPVGEPLKGTLIRQDVEIIGSSTSAIIAAPFPVRLTMGPNVGQREMSGPSGVTVDVYGGVQNGAVMDPGQTYTVWSRVPDTPADELRRAPSNKWDDVVRQCYVDQQSLEVSAALGPLVREITAAATNDYDRAIAIQRYLEEHCAYTLNVPLTPAGADPVVHFVLKTRRGACDLFASAMTLMCRLAGVPARVATGFAPGEYDPSVQAVIVRGTDAHAWSEVLFKDIGWIPFDPAARRSLEGQGLAELLRMGQWRLILEQVGRGLLSALIVLLSAYVAATALVDLRPSGRALMSRLRRARPMTRATDEAALLLRLVARRAGFTCTPALTPRECLNLLAASPRAALLAPVAADLRLAFDRLYALRFRRALDEDQRRAEAVALSRDLRDLTRRVRRLRA